MCSAKLGCSEQTEVRARAKMAWKRFFFRMLHNPQRSASVVEGKPRAHAGRCLAETMQLPFGFFFPAAADSPPWWCARKLFVLGGVAQFGAPVEEFGSVQLNI